MLMEILELIRRQRRLSLTELTGHLRIESAALEPMMEILVRKRMVKVLAGGCPNSSCRGCSCADRESMLIYEAADNEVSSVDGAEAERS